MFADNNALVLEDLNRFNYKLANRKHRLDFERAKIVMEKLAKFHATTTVMHSKQPELMKLHVDSPFHSDEPTPLTMFFAISIQETLETVRNVPHLAKFVPLLETVDIVEREKKVFSRDADDTFHVLNHGDLWINNVFFSENEKQEPIDAMLVRQLTN